MEISNSLVAILVVADIAVSMTSTFSTMNVLDSLSVKDPVGEVLTGYLSGTVNVTINQTVSISWVKQRVDFFLNVPASGLNFSDNTTDGSPSPLAIQNDGSQNVNITIYASDGLFAGSATDGASDNYFESKCGDNTTNCDVAGAIPKSQTVFTPINISSAGAQSTLIIWNMSFNASSDILEIEINATVPPDEPGGEKEATIVLTGTNACPGDPRCHEVD